MKVNLYTTSGCHLCELAITLLEDMVRAGEIMEIKEIEIANSEILIQEYGTRIPVVAIHEEELDWPFEIPALKKLIKKYKIQKSIKPADKDLIK
ncbi:MAG: hypothetical protein CMQ40_11585 [Gammaproteobacteria bacterium]|nr:hypothetical protein [Gammaproteobacteria bacterium]|tara:strand:+ start:161 stop:442 length:282 start_codon:yes stop_codon:yes gene_type:complete